MTQFQLCFALPSNSLWGFEDQETVRIPAPGVWWFDGYGWVAYPQDVEELVLKTRDYNPNGSLTVVLPDEVGNYRTFHVDLDLMVQVDVRTGNGYTLSIVEKPEEKEEDVANKTIEVTKFDKGAVYYTDSITGTMQLYSEEETRRILVAAAAGDLYLVLEQPDNRLLVHLNDMKAFQLDAVGCLGLSNKIISSSDVSLNLPWNPRVAKSSMDGKKTLQKEVLYGLVNVTFDEISLGKIKAQHEDIDGIDVFQHIESMKPYEDMAKMVSNWIICNKYIAGEVVDAAREHKLDKVWSYVFHCVDSEDIRDVLKEGIHKNTPYKKVEDLSKADSKQLVLSVVFNAKPDKALPVAKVTLKA